MSRPRRKEKQVYFIKLWLLPSRDGDVIRYLENAPAGQRGSCRVTGDARWFIKPTPAKREAEEMEIHPR